ncbi:BTAD domain-containing putative transcriptional regulator [Nocardia sp. CDC153]|uniref:BTAD domain-containing putative transcriptional regulator n=1 Tax=Nocardia sp. CDC153 TaxID=3112167 RepID=UPI002DBEA7B9|nr:BTAD domain-containing putative transcriptional regulator [Nocardia sp. CDC153]MEC3956738.1 BTAD domain-containing putative transcriptional regulator [Nocardia sp. CDC153]
MAGAELRVLGPLQLSVDGHDIPLGTPIQRAVLGRLIVAHGQVVSTERLSYDLWAGHPPPKAAAVLQVHVHNLRRLFEPHRPRRAPSRFIVSESSGYALKIPEDAVDAWHFEQQLRTYQELVSNPDIHTDAVERNALLEAALALWHGPALEAFAEADWAIAEADRLTDLYLTAVELNARAELELGRSGEVVRELRQLFEDHPGREEIVRLLALAQYQLGQQLQALTTIRRSRDFLAMQFGVDPSPALRDLEIAILNHSATLGSTAATPPTTPADISVTTAARPESVAAREHGPAADAGGGQSQCATGYVTELSELLRTAEAARGGRLRLAWVSGEAGIGKTVLAEAVLSALANANWLVATGTCPEIDGAPTAWAWTEILTALESATGAAATTSAARPRSPAFVTTAGPIRSESPPPRGDEETFTLARVIAEKCRAATTSGPVALLLEDVQRADPATLQVLRQVASWLRDEPVFVLVSLRRSEAGRGAHDSVAALAQYTGTWVDLTGLDAEGTRQVARAAGADELDDEQVALLRRRTGGNPLFVREVAKSLAGQGDSDDVPDSIRELIEVRVEKLPPGVAEVLRHVSVWGEGADLAILSASTGLAEDVVIDLVAAAERAGLVQSRSGGSVRFEHGMIRDAVYAGIPALRRGRMHWAALELLEARADAFAALARDPEVLARHASAGATAETASRAIEYVERAAEQRYRRGMRSASVRLLRSAVELHRLARHDADHASEADRIALLRTRCALVTALAYDNRHREARAERDRALTLAEQLGDPNLVVRALTCWRAPVIWAIRDWSTPDQHMRRALARALARHGVPRAALVLLETGTAPPGSASDDAEAFVGHRDSSDAASGELVLLLVASTFETGLVEYPAGHRLATWALAIARRTGDPELLCAAINAVTYLAFDYGPEFARLVTELEEVAAAAGLAEYRALAQYLGYRAAVARTDLREAGRRVSAAVEFADEGQLRPLLDMVGCFAATMELLRGDVDTAEQLYRRFATHARQSGMLNHAEAELFCALSIGWARGDLSGLLDRLANAYAALPASAAPAYTLALLQAGQHERARVVYENSDPIAAGFYPVLMSALRAVAAIEFSDIPAIHRLYEYLAPHAGTLIGLESGMTQFGPMDAILARLAAALGDTERAAAHRDHAERQLERIRSELPDRDAALPRESGSGHWSDMSLRAEPMTAGHRFPANFRGLD